MTTVNSGRVLATFQRVGGVQPILHPDGLVAFKLVTAMSGNVRIFARRGFPDKLLLRL